jgi:hypothetical protein
MVRENVARSVSDVVMIGNDTQHKLHANGCENYWWEC